MARILVTSEKKAVPWYGRTQSPRKKGGSGRSWDKGSQSPADFGRKGLACFDEGKDPTESNTTGSARKRLPCNHGGEKHRSSRQGEEKKKNLSEPTETARNKSTKGGLRPMGKHDPEGRNITFIKREKTPNCASLVGKAPRPHP